ncbi:MAG: HAD family phosphatase [Caldilineaceae bacterium SB0670_bin_27]|uniref:HAD family phosphatase n=1 Tax=Caldilineaceae bacterium SB0664_bin_27 TaxID=2605260 RepID=A0A6B0YV64_9CHLR|nr:HAD family phosphatase [Caldilineaceae bacterium SB0664_bin_27]MYJ77325.1 HAD family phosphatase [Caldilineaceae bacterium SB0670_bin_27]
MLKTPNNKKVSADTFRCCTISPERKHLNPSPKIRLISVDLDGTLLRSDGTPAPAGVRQLQTAARSGVRVVLNTTRNLDGVRSMCEAWGFSDPLICTNGAQILASPGGPEWASYTIPMAVARSIARLADRNDWEVSTSVGGQTFFRQRPGQPLGPVEYPLGSGNEGTQRRTRLVIVPTNEEALVAEPKRMILHEPEVIDAVKELSAQYSQECRTETYYEPDGRLHSLCIFPLRADKGTALRLVAGKLDIPLGQVLAIGDNPNDMPMFAAAGTSVAMGNAPPEVKNAATVVGPVNDDEGVAWAVQRFVLGVRN